MVGAVLLLICGADPRALESERWREPVRRACAALASSPDTDPNATIRLTLEGDALVVEVTTEDGRATRRRVPHPDALARTLEALASVPLPPPPPSPAPAIPDAPVIHPAAPDPPPIWRPGFELGVGAGARNSGAQAYESFAIEGYAQMRIVDVVIGLAVRWDAFESKTGALPPSFEMSTTGASLFVARRFEPRFGDLDGGASPRVVAETQSCTNANTEISGSEFDIRLGGTMRARFGHGAFRPFVALDGELSPSRLGRHVRIDPGLPTLPDWSAGLDVGLAWTSP